MVAASSWLTMPTSACPGDKEPSTSCPSAFVLDAGDEIPHHWQCHIGLEQRHAHLAQHVRHVGLGDAGLPSHFLDETGEFVGRRAEAIGDVLGERHQGWAPKGIGKVQNVKLST